MRKCAYCQKSGNLTKEHVFSDCVTQVLHPDKKGVLAFDPSRANIFRAGDFKIRDVCAECNNDRLSPLDAAAKRLCEFAKEYSSHNREASFTIEDPEKVVRWLLKTGFNWSRTIRVINPEIIEECKGYIISGEVIPHNLYLRAGFLYPPIVDGKEDRGYLLVNGPGIFPANTDSKFGASYVVVLAGLLILVLLPTGNRRARREKISAYARGSDFEEMKVLNPHKNSWNIPRLSLNYEEFYAGPVRPYLEQYEEFVRQFS